eukprot:s120_g46.t1
MQRGLKSEELAASEGRAEEPTPPLGDVEDLTQVLLCCNTLERTGCALAWTLVHVGLCNGTDKNSILYLMLNNTGAWLRAKQKRVALPVREGDLAGIREVLQKRSMREVVDEFFTQQHGAACWTYLACFACNFLWGQMTPLAAGKWTAAERRLGEAVGSMTDRLLSHGAGVEVDVSAVEKDLKLSRINYAGEEVGVCHKLSLRQVLPALPPLGHGGAVDLINFVSPVTKRFLQNPELCILPDKGQSLPKLQGRIHMEAGETDAVANALVSDRLHDLAEDSWRRAQVMSSDKKRKRGVTEAEELGAMICGRGATLGPSSERLLKDCMDGLEFYEDEFWTWVEAKAPNPKLEQWLEPGATWPGEHDAGAFPTALRAIIRTRPPPKPAGLHRTGELLSIKPSNCLIKGDRVLLTLEYTKTGKRDAATESVSFEDSFTALALEQVLELRQIQRCTQIPIWLNSAQNFRNKFNYYMRRFDLQAHAFRPYSLRRGGATALFQESGSIETALLRGRWQSVRVAKIYLTDGLSYLPGMTFSLRTSQFACSACGAALSSDTGFCDRCGRRQDVDHSAEGDLVQSLGRRLETLEQRREAAEQRAGQLVELRRLVAEGRHKQYLTHFMTLDDQGFAFCSAVGDPGEDLRVLAAMPSAMLGEAVTAVRMSSGRRLTPVEAIQLGMVYRACHLLVHLSAGGSQATWRDPDPWNAPTSSQSTMGSGGTTSLGSAGASSQERKMKLSQVADQGDESEFMIMPESQKAAYYTKYVAKVGGMPADSEDPTMEQISAVYRKVRVLGQPPYCDFAVWVPFAKKHLRAQKYQSFVLQEDGTFMAKMVPGPTCYAHWQASYRVLRTTLVMLEVISLANLMEWEAMIERLQRQYPGCWGLVAAADDRARGEFMSKTFARLRLEVEQGATPPLGWNLEEPWNVVWRKVMQDKDFWTENVHNPAIGWLARGQKGKPLTPIEEMAETALRGGRHALQPEWEGQEDDGGNQGRRKNKVRREARKKKLRADREELQSYRKGTGSKGGGPKGSGPTGAKGLKAFLWWLALRQAAGDTGAQGGGPSSSSSTGASDGRALPGHQVVKEVRKGTKRRRFTGDDPPGDEEPPKNKIHVKGDKLTFEEYLKVRKFIFLHHFSGQTDNLSKAVSEECEKIGIQVETTSVDLSRGHDLMREEPYRSHKRAAEDGVLDGYHAGFPCNTFTKLRWREAPGLPKPLRSKQFPYGFRHLDPKEKTECNVGTILMARAVGLAEAVFKADRFMRVPSFVTLENPPPSDHPEHISAWHMPELVELVDKISDWKCAHFNTCAYESNIPLGAKHYKPQMLGGTLQNVDALNRTCQCGNRPHEPIIGKDRSSKSAAYPEEFCRAYGELAAKHFMNMARAEFLEGRLKLLSDRIDYLKVNTRGLMREAESLDAQSKRVENSREYRKGVEHRNLRLRSPAASTTSRSSWDPSEGVDWSRSSSQERDVVEATPAGKSSSAKRQKVELKTKEQAEKAAAEHTGEASANWTGGSGKHGMLKEPRAKDEVPQALTYLGGMRDPHKAVVKRPTLQAQGQKLWERWRKFAVSHTQALEVAESYGTESCHFDEAVLEEWRKEMCELWGINTPTARSSDAEEYETPVFFEMLKAWVSKSGDPDWAVPKWLEEGTPLGIERPIEVCGIFPPSDEPELEGDVRAHVISDAVLERPDSLKNYKSVEDELDHANVELERYATLKYLKKVTLGEAETKYPNSTVSRLGLVLKTKESGEVKRRIVIDLRRSGGNQKSRLPERLVLPRLVDALKLMKEVRKRSTTASDPEGEDEVERALVDVQDAFTVLPLHKQEHKHALAPSTTEGELLVFQALLFGFKVAPLLYSRFAALIARMLQSAIRLNRGGHEVYLDDSLWFLQGTLAARTNTLSFILNTMGALGIKVSLKKGTRANKATWIGVSLDLIDKDTVIVGLPIKFIDELQGMLNKWDNAGFAAIKELRVVAGKCAWLGGVLPRARWVTSVLYAVLSQALKEEEEEKGPTTRNRKGLFAVKRLELARQWLYAFLSAAKLRPMRRISLKPGGQADVRITTDASPGAVGGMLVVNKRIIAAYFSLIDKEQADELLVEHKASAFQGVLEALAILVALRRWSDKIRGMSLTLTVQSDSVTALALSQKLSAKSSSPGLNFIGSELSLCIEELGVEEIKQLHVPGKANVEADWLSRPDTWESSPMPKALEGIDIQSELGPKRAFYRLPTPKEAPSLWGVKDGAAGQVAVWNAVS